MLNANRLSGVVATENIASRGQLFLEARTAASNGVSSYHGWRWWSHALTVRRREVEGLIGADSRGGKMNRGEP